MAFSLKIAILAASSSKYFPLFFNKPKCLYHLNGMIQLQRVIEDAKLFADEKDIFIVGGYKYKLIQDFLKKNYPKITLKVNNRYRESAIYSFRTAANGENDDIVFMFADESISRENIKKICQSQRKMAIMCHDDYYYYSLGIMKLRREVLSEMNDNRYLSMKALKEIYCFANNKKEYDGDFSINSGICLGYIIIDLIRKIGGINKIENPINTHTGEDIDFIHYNPKSEYIPDLDYYSDTDEYKTNLPMRLFSDYISDPIRWVLRLPGRILRKIKKTWAKCAE